MKSEDIITITCKEYDELCRIKKKDKKEVENHNISREKLRLEYMECRKLYLITDAKLDRIPRWIKRIFI
jgi:hypothetical protein